MIPDVPPVEIPVRDPALEFDSSIPHHWFAGRALVTHVFNGFNLVFPDGERFFIRSVRDHLPRVEDPELRRQVKGFFGQEAHHAAEHERYFATLEAQGYEIRPLLRRFSRFMAWSNRWFPARLRLAITAGAEHYTATMGAFAFEDPLLAEAHPTMRKLIIWHATEEIEHKAVAFDVLRATHPSYLLRMAGFAIATVSLLGWATAGTRLLVRSDLRAGRLDRASLQAERRELRARQREFAPRFLANLRRYLRPDFHPNQTDELPLAHRRLAEVGLSPQPLLPAARL